MRPKKCLTFLMVVAVFGFLSSPVGATPITASDLDSLTLGSEYAAPITTDFLDFFGNDLGDLTTSVYNSAGLYTYVLEAIPGQDNISEFNTSFKVKGFNDVAGFSFSEAALAGTDFTIWLGDDGTLDWNAAIEDAWDTGENITFFFQSTHPSYFGEYYQAIDGSVSIAKGYATNPVPVPEPATIFLLGAGLVGLGLFGRSRFRKT